MGRDKGVDMVAVDAETAETQATDDVEHVLLFCTYTVVVYADADCVCSSTGTERGIHRAQKHAFVGTLAETNDMFRA